MHVESVSEHASLLNTTPGCVLPFNFRNNVVFGDSKGTVSYLFFLPVAARPGFNTICSVTWKVQMIKKKKQKLFKTENNCLFAFEHMIKYSAVTNWSIFGEDYW